MKMGVRCVAVGSRAKVRFEFAKRPGIFVDAYAVPLAVSAAGDCYFRPRQHSACGDEYEEIAGY
jgi:hypothetical protein